jgi:hypothetical protein
MNMSDIDEGRSLVLSGSLDRPLRWLIAIMLIPTLGIAVAITLGFSHAAPAARPPMMLAAATAPLVFVLAMIMIVRSLKRARVYVDQGELVVKPGMGSKRVALSALRKNGLRVVNLSERPDLKPVLKLWGTGLPGFAGGRFRLRNGETAVCLLLDRDRVSYLRSEDGKLALLLSLAEPEKLRTLLER